jgi:hypothetical protein
MADPAELPADMPAELVAPYPFTQPLPTQPIEDITEIITQLERQTVDAHTKRDATIFNTFLAPHSRAISSKGVLYDPRADEWQRWKSPQITNLQVLRVTTDVAIVHYQLKVDDYYKPGWPVKHLRSTTWKRDPGIRDWKRVFHQVTRIS